MLRFKIFKYMVLLGSFCAIYGCSEELLELSNDEILELSIVSLEPYFADGNSQVLVQAKLLADASDKMVTVVFSSDGGTFDTTSVKVGENGIALGTFVPGVESGRFTIGATIEGADQISVSQTIRLGVRSTSDILSITAPETTLQADGNSQVSLGIGFDNYNASAVKLTSNLGSFDTSESDELVLNMKPGSKEVITYNISNKVSNHIITAEIIGLSSKLDKVLPVERAYPDELIIQPSRFEIDSLSGDVTLDISLLRGSGTVSTGTAIDLIAYQNNSTNQVGRFKGLPATSDTNGNVSVSFVLDTRRAVTDLPIIIQAKSLNDMNEDVVSEIELTVIK